MKRIALIAASSVAVIAASLAIAQPQPLPQASGSDRPAAEQSQSREERREERRSERRERMTERLESRMNERLAKLRTDMDLKPDQVPLFERVEQVIKKTGEERRERWSSMRDQRENFRHADIMERLDMMSNRQMERASATKELADAVRPLWATLSDPQKTVARRAVRETMAEGRGRMREMRDRMRGQDDDHGDWRGHDRDNGSGRGRDEWRDRRG